MQHFDVARLSPNSVRNTVWHALGEPVCQYLRTRNPRCSTVYIDNSLGPLARDSPCTTFHNLFISVRGFTCFRWFLRPSSGYQNCTYSVRYLSDRYCYLPSYVQFRAPDDGQKNRLKHVERLTEINKL